VALSIAPAFILAHGLSLLLHGATGAAAFAPNGYTMLYYVFCVAWALAIGMLGMVYADRLVVERFAVRGRYAAAAVLTVWLGTNYIWYFVREPFVAHMIGASWVIFAVYVVHRIEQRLRQGSEGLLWWHLPLLAFVTSMALACRLTNAFLLPLLVYLAVVLCRRGVTRRALKLMPVVLVALAPLLIQAAVTHAITGQAGIPNLQQFGYRAKERFYWTQPALIRSLFSSYHGLLVSTPALLLAVWGLAWQLVRRQGWRDPLLLCWVASALVLWYVNSAWYAWWFGHSIGNRGFLELAGLFVIGFALAYARLGEVRRRWRWGVLALVAMAVALQYLIIVLHVTRRIDIEKPLLPSVERVFTGRWERI
jgi:hypothetical protein